MIDFGSKGYTNEQIYAIIAEYEASGEGITVFCAKRDHKPSYQTLKGWLATVSEASAKPAAPAPSVPTSLADVEAAYKANIQSFITTLEKREQELSKELESVKSDLKKAREKLTKFD